MLFVNKTTFRYHVQDMASVPRIYLDNAAATVVDPRVLSAMQPYWREHIGNAGSLHAEGVRAHRTIEDARERSAEAFGVHADEVIFTSGGTESNNLAIRGLVELLAEERSLTSMHVITSDVEHSSVRDCVDQLLRKGVQVTRIPVDETGRIDLVKLRGALRPETVLVSVLYANNEVGTIEDIPGIYKVIKRFRRGAKSQMPYFHTDASQATPWISCKVDALGVDMMTIDGQKVHGPKGVGLLYRKRDVHLKPILYGGSQEHGLRPGTPPTPLIVGISTAIAIVEDERDFYVPQVSEMRDTFVSTLSSTVGGVLVNGPERDARTAGNANVSFMGLEGERFVLELDARGVAASTRSACLKTNKPGSYVVQALYNDRQRARGAVRFSLSRFTTGEEMKRATDIVIDTVRKLDEAKH